MALSRLRIEAQKERTEEEKKRREAAGQTIGEASRLRQEAQKEQEAKRAAGIPTSLPTFSELRESGSESLRNREILQSVSRNANRNPAPNYRDDNDEEEKKSASGWDVAGNAIWSGLGQFNKGIASTVDFVLPTELLFGDEKDPFSQINRYYSGVSDRFNQRLDESLADKSKGARTAANIGVSTVAAIPNAIIAMMTGGTSLAAQGTTASLQAAQAGTGIASTIGTVANNLSRNPMYWSSMAQTLGTDYEQAKANGANEWQASATAIISSALNAGVEVSGGIEVLPARLRSGNTSAILDWVMSMPEEGVEEVIQRFISGTTDKAIYDHDKAAFSLTDPDAIVNPVEMGKEFAMGTAVGGILGGAQIGGINAANAVIDRMNNNRLGKLGTDYQSSAEDLVNEGLSFAPESEAYQTAQEVKTKMDAGQTVTDADLGRVVVANERTMQAEERLAQANRPVETLEEVAREAVQAEQGVSVEDDTSPTPIEMPAREAVSAKESVPYNVMATSNPVRQAAVAEQKKLGYGEEGMKLFREIAQSNSMDKTELMVRFDTPYQAGLTGLPMKDANLVNDFQIEAYNAGRMDYIARMAKDKQHKLGAVLSEAESGFDHTGAPKSLTQAERNFTDFLFKKMGIKGSWDGQDGKAKYNAFYDSSTGGVTFAQDFGIDPKLMEKLGSEDFMKKVERLESEREESFIFYVAHEVATHVAMNRAPAEMRAFVNAMYNYKQGMETGENLARGKQTFYAKNKVALDTEGAIEEVVADAILDLYHGDAKAFMEAVYRIANGTDEQAKKGARTYKEMLSDFIKKLKAWARKLTGRENAEARANVEKSISELEQLRDMFEQAISTSMKAVETARQNPGKQTAANVGEIKNSIKGVATAAGIDASRDPATGKVVFKLDGKVVTKVTAAHIKNKSALGGLITTANENGFISGKEAEIQYKAAADIMNMIINTQDPEMVWAWVGSSMFSAIKSNADGQYGTTVDFTTVCRKTQDMITAMSKSMMKLKRGLTKDEVTKLQAELIAEGSSVPCPVCYVFSRWAGIGSVLDNMYRWQEKYDGYTEAQLNEQIATLTEKLGKGKARELAKLLREQDEEYDNLSFEKEKLALEKKQLTSKKKTAVKNNDARTLVDVNNRLAEIDKRNPQINKRMKAIKDSVAPELAWLLQVRTQPDYDTRGKVRANVLFNLDDAATFAEEFPLAWKYRTSRGPSAGKAILPYSDMRAGDIILGVGNTSADGNTTFANATGKFTTEQKAYVEKAIKRAKAQNLIGGQRFQSTSDFRYDYALDYLMAFWECQAIGSKMQTYTKIIEFGDMVAAVGGDFNLSVMPRNKGYITLPNGKNQLVFSSVTGIDFEAAKRSNEMHDNGQLILVGINDEHILAALEDSEETRGAHIGFVIPYHASGASINEFIRVLVSNLGETYMAKSYQDYSDVQSDKERKNATADQKRRNDLRTKLLRGKDGGKNWEPTEDDLAFIRGESKSIVGRSFAELREIERKALRGDKAAIAEYESWTAGALWELYNKMWVEGGAEYGVRLNTAQAKSVMPHEYWNKTVNRDQAYINGFLFRSYCYNLGLTPRFSGAVVKGEKHGDFTDSKGYWKTLIDRPMYRNDGTYRDQQMVNMSTFNQEMLKADYAKENWAGYSVQEPDVKRAERAAERFVEKVQSEITEASDGNVQYSLRTKPDPKKTIEVYKLMRLENGAIKPLFIDSTEELTPGLWYDADSPNLDFLKKLPSGIFLVDANRETYTTFDEYLAKSGEKKTKYPSKKAIEKAAAEGKRWVYIEDVVDKSGKPKKQRRYGGETRKYWNLGINGSGAVNLYAMRPGYHAGSLPTMRQIGKGPNKDLRDDTFVWTVGEVPADIDYQAEANRNPDKDIPTHIPVDGYYLKATNADKAKSQADVMGWYVAGSYKINRIISDAEARSIIDKWNAEHPDAQALYDYERESGMDFDADLMKLVPKDKKYSLKTARPSDPSHAPVFYSKMEQVVQGVKQEKLGAASVVSMLKGKGVKDEEIKWSGIDDWLHGKKSVTKQELLEFIRANDMVIEEKILDNATVLNGRIPISAEDQERMRSIDASIEANFEGIHEWWNEAFGEYMEIDDPNQFLLRGGLEESLHDVAWERYSAAKRKVIEPAVEAIAAHNSFGNLSRDEIVEMFEGVGEYDHLNVDEKMRFLKVFDRQGGKNFDALTSSEIEAIKKFFEVTDKGVKGYSETPATYGEMKTAEQAMYDLRYDRRKLMDKYYDEEFFRRTKWENYKLPGGDNYRELLFEKPDSAYSNTAMESHWGDYRSGILAHARVQDFDTANGKMLFVEEIQSDWHNEGHKHGYKKKDQEATLRNTELKLEDGVYVLYRNGERTREYVSKDRAERAIPGITKDQVHQKLVLQYNGHIKLMYDKSYGDVPDAPYAKNYHEFVLKRILRMAAEEGYDSIGWTTGKMQEERWSSEYAEGYRIEYDQDIPKFLNKYGKKWGATVGKAKIGGFNYQADVDAQTDMTDDSWLLADGISDDGTEVWSMPITDAMKESVLHEGQSMFSLKGEQAMRKEIKRIRTEGAKAGKSEAEIENDIMAVVGPEYGELIKTYGEIKRGERAAREIEVPRKTEEDRHVSQTIRTVLEAEATPDAAVPTIQQLIAQGDFSYDVITDKAAMAGAEKVLRTKGYETALAEWISDVKDGKVSKANTAIGWALYNQAANAGDLKTAMTILDGMIKHQRNAAQAVQATRILKKLSPDAQLYGVKRSVDNLKEDLIAKYGKKAPDLEINEELARKLLKAKTDEERDAAMRELYQDIGKQIPASFVDKWNAWRYLAMLGNPRTHVRNVVGNLGFAPVVVTKDLAATVIESMVGFVSRGKMGRTKAMPGAALLKAAWDDYANVASEISGSGKYNDAANKNQAIEDGRVIFKTKPLEKARKANSAALEMEDMWFAKPHYAFALAQYCKAHGVTADQLRRGKALGNARAYAIKEAQKATYRDTNAFSETISELGRYHGDNAVKKGVSVVMEGILPFRKTPANILVRGLEYSPMGLVKGLTWDLAKVKKGDITAADAIDNIAAGLTGTGLLAFGLWAAAEGLIRGAGGDDEEEKKYEELQGHQSYALELPDGTSVTLDWLSPEALPVFIGVNLYEMARDNKGKSNLADILTAVSNVTEPLLEMSCLQSLNDLFDSVGYATSGGLSALPSALASAATSYLTQAFPTILGQAERSAQDVRMTTYTEKDNFLTSDLQYTLGKISARLPGWDFQQIPYVDAWGRTESTGSRGENVANNFLNPAYMSQIETSAMEEELQRLYEATGEKGVLPDRAGKDITVNKEKKYLTAEEYVQYATERGQMSYDLLTDLTSRPEYRAASDAEKVEIVDKAYEYATAVAKSKVSDYKPDGWVAKAIKAEKAVGMDETEYMLYELALSAVDQPNKNGEYGGTPTQEEKAAAIALRRNLSDDAVAFLWDTEDAYDLLDAGVDMRSYVEYVGTGGSVNAEKLIDMHNQGIGEETYFDFLDILKEVDQPTKSGKMGSYTQDEAAAAIKAIPDLSRAERAALWQSVNKSWKAKNNPWR